MRRNVRLKDIAELAGVSIATVSRVINGVPTVNPHISQKVRQVMRELDYEPNHMARALKRRKSKILGIMLPHMTNGFFATISEAFVETANQYGYMTVIGNSFWNEQNEKSYFARLRQIQADGMVLLPASYKTISSVPEIPVVLVDKFVDGFTCVGTDNTFGLGLAVEHLVDLGHRRIALLGNMKDQKKWDGYRLALGKCYISYDESIVLDSSKAPRRSNEGWLQLDWYVSICQRFNDDDSPTAVVCFSDWHAIQMKKALEKSGFSVPARVAVVGYDNTDLAELADITSIAQPAREIGRIAAERLIDDISERSTKPEHIILQPKLVVRNSTSLVK